LIVDGAMGTMLQEHIAMERCMDIACIETPELICTVHRAYIEAGADIISTNSFSSNRIKLQEFNLESRTEEINRAAAKLAHKAANGRVLVAGCIGPTGQLVEPLGTLSFDELYDVYRQQAVALAEGGVDLFLMETFSDLKEIKIGLMAIRENTDLPVIASMTFDEEFVTFAGTDPVTAAIVLTSLGADVIGVNCSTGPAPMLEVLGRLVLSTARPILVEPNAGIPKLRSNKVVYQVSPKQMAEYARKFIEIGANLVGTCCGSTPEHTAQLRRVLQREKPLSRHVPNYLRLSSRVRSVEIGTGLPFCIIGERINPTNKEDFQQEIRDGSVSLLQEEAQKQATEGARLLDVNIGVPGIDEPAVMGRVVRAVENVTDLPLCIDNVNPPAIEAALRECSGKVLINSVNGEVRSLDTILPLAKRYGAGLLCLAVGQEGIPKSAEERLAVLKSIVEKAQKAGIARQDLICDCLTLTVSAQQKRAEETLRAVRMVKEELALPTVLGVSNISYGLPERSLINSTFLSMAMAAGLDAAIINPGDLQMMETVRAASVLTVRDRDSREFIKIHTRKKKKQKTAPDLGHMDRVTQKVSRAVLLGNRYEIGTFVEEALYSGRSAMEINNSMLIPAIQEVGRQYDRKEIFLPQMILAAETMQEAFKVLKPRFSESGSTYEGTVILCTVKGDVHDIGKNIVGLFLRNHGFRVVDLGKDVHTEEIVKKAVEIKADIVALSALMTTTMMEMQGVIQELRKAQSSARVMVGGAVVTKRYAREIGADGYAKDGVSAVEMVKSMVTGRE
jgi:5-methyltetrahydrofolate--homocysteine methyltransferase